MVVPIQLRIEKKKKKKRHTREKKMNACFSLGGYQYL
jgi:hypothetical protein